MTESRIIDHETGEWVNLPPDADDFVMLDVRSPSGTVLAEARPNWLATISAGKKDEKGYPAMVRDGTIQLQDPDDRAPTLRAALEASDAKRLTIAFSGDDMSRFILQHFTRRSQTKLEVHGDQFGLHVLNGPKWDCVTAGTPEYRQLLATCKCEVSVLFHLAEWDGQRARVVLDDGLSPYRLRFTSRNSLRSIVGTLNELRLLTGGRIAGIPHELMITYRDVAAPDGAKRNVAVWSIQFRLPGGLSLSSGNFGEIVSQALAEGQRLRLVAPVTETLATALLDEPDVDLDEIREPSGAQLTRLQDGDPRCDPASYEKAYFAAVDGSPYDTDEGRAGLVLTYTAGRTHSLAEFLTEATESQANAFVVWVSELVEAAQAEARHKRVQELLGGKSAREIWQRNDEWDVPRRTTADAAPTVIDVEPAPPPLDPTPDELDELPEAATIAAEAEPEREPLASADQKAAIARLASPARLRELDLERITAHDAGVLIQELNPPRTSRPPAPATPVS